MNRSRIYRLSIALLFQGIAVSFAPQFESDAQQPRSSPSVMLANAAETIRGRFEQADLDDDQRLSLQEFQSLAKNDKRQKRDFLLHDFDHSGDLSQREFASVVGIVEPWLRGSIPDPFDNLIEQAVAALDESYDGWNRRPREMVNAHSFVANFLGSISFGNKRFVTGRILRQADRNADGKMSRQEARVFLQLQLGTRWFEPPPLREPTGRLLRFDRFLSADVDRSGSLSKTEWLAAPWFQQSEHGDIKRWDRDGNGQLSYAEFAEPTGPFYLDTLQWFRNADTNLDSTLDAEELTAATDQPRAHLVGSTFTGFDTNHDGRLTLLEYRASMHSCVNYSWDRRCIDQNGDLAIDYSEFRFDDLDLFHLQRRYFFHRLDIDGDGRLSSREFAFKAKN